MSKIAPIAWLWGCICLGVVGPALGSGEEPFRLREPGESIPAMTLHDLQGSPHSLSRERAGGPVLLFFWSVYCPNCKEAMPGLVELYETWKERDLLVWAVNVDGERFSNGVVAYVKDMGLPFPVVYDRLEGEYLVAADPLGISKTPSLYLAGADGRIHLRQVIEMDYLAVSRAIRAMGD